jgi:hypothetical protein
MLMFIVILEEEDVEVIVAAQMGVSLRRAR